jgi:hypothetical protein
MLLDTKAMRHLAAEDWRVLTAVSSQFLSFTILTVVTAVVTPPLTPPPTPR